LRRLLAALFLLAAAPAHAAPPLFFNHSYAVLDAETAEAIEHSDYLKRFGVFEVRTTTADGGESWKGRYLAGRQTYLEFFGPADLQGAVLGAAGVAISPDRSGGLARIKRALKDPQTARRTRQFGTDQVPWFDFAAPPGDPKSFSIWAMEYVPSYFEDSRAGKEPAEYPGDISRERYQSDAYAQRLLRDVAVVEIACPPEDIKPAAVLFAAAGFSLRKTRERLEASDGNTTVILDSVPLEQAGLRRIVFDLNAPAEDAHVERIGRSTLVAGPGTHAVWTF
jgi:hypothetical protein